MILLVSYVLVAVFFSFLCSIAEAVLLSVTTSYVVNLEKEGRPAGAVLKKLKADINSPLAVILTLNTIAHTIGAAGAGAQAAAVFGSVYVGLFSALLTLIILIFSEIIPKALGAQHWRALAPLTGHVLSVLVRVFYPFVLVSNKLTAGLSHGPTLDGFSRQEFAAMAELGEREGQLDSQEARVMQNLLLLRETYVEDVMTPRAVVLSFSATSTVSELLALENSQGFSRIPLIGPGETVNGFVLRSDILLAQAGSEGRHELSQYARDLPAIADKTTLLKAFDAFVSNAYQIMLVVDEYGGIQGIITLEDILETLLGLEIMDENDTIADLQQVARRLGQLRRSKLGLSDEG